MSTLNFNPFNIPTPPTIPLSLPIFLDIHDYTHLWHQGEDSAYYAESATWGRNPVLFSDIGISVNFDIFMNEGQVYLA